MKPIARRIYYAIISLCCLLLVVFNLIAWSMQESLEETMLEIEFQQERDFFLQQFDFAESVLISSEGHLIAYEKKGAPLPQLPDFFLEFPKDYRGEIERHGKTFLFTIETLPGGVLYISKDISHFEKQELLFALALLVISGVAVLLSLFLAGYLSHRIARPLEQLADAISRTQAGVQMQRLDTDYDEIELHSISDSFNQFLMQIEQFVQREKNLLNMASHELKTPLAVMLGGLDILDKRGNLSPKDEVTLQRIRHASQIMQNNVEVLLKLARSEANPSELAQHSLAEILRQVQTDLEAADPAVADRLSLNVLAEPTVFTQFNMAYMVARNLIQNAIQHSKGQVEVSLFASYFTVCDEGSGLTAQQVALLEEGMGLAKAPSGGGLGLYIVTLMCERLQWRLEVVEAQQQGASIRVIFAP